MSFKTISALMGVVFSSAFGLMSSKQASSGITIHSFEVGNLGGKTELKFDVPFSATPGPFTYVNASFELKIGRATTVAYTLGSKCSFNSGGVGTLHYVIPWNVFSLSEINHLVISLYNPNSKTSDTAKLDFTRPKMRPVLVNRTTKKATGPTNYLRYEERLHSSTLCRTEYYFPNSSRDYLDSIYRIVPLRSLSFTVYNPAKSFVLDYSNAQAFLHLYNDFEDFKSIGTISNLGTLKIPLTITKRKDEFLFFLKEEIIINTKTMKLRGGKVLLKDEEFTDQLYLPGFVSGPTGSYRLKIDINDFGETPTEIVSIPFTMNFTKNLFGNCLNSEFCVGVK